MYALLDSNNNVIEIIKEEDDMFPGLSIYDRYSEEFCNMMVKIPDGQDVDQNDVYDQESNTFHKPEQTIPVYTPSIDERVTILEGTALLYSDLATAIREGVNDI